MRNGGSFGSFGPSNLDADPPFGLAHPEADARADDRRDVRGWTALNGRRERLDAT
jgi:hypothetical protein